MQRSGAPSCPAASTALQGCGTSLPPARRQAPHKRRPQLGARVDVGLTQVNEGEVGQVRQAALEQHCEEREVQRRKRRGCRGASGCRTERTRVDSEAGDGRHDLRSSICTAEDIQTAIRMRSQPFYDFLLWGIEW